MAGPVSGILAAFLGGAVGTYTWRTVQPWLLRWFHRRRRFLIVVEHALDSTSIGGMEDADDIPPVVIELATVLAGQVLRDPELAPVQVTVEVPR